MRWASAVLFAVWVACGVPQEHEQPSFDRHSPIGPCLTTCEQAGAECGAPPDRCGATLSCYHCPLGETCGGGGGAFLCGDEDCVPRTCEALECGMVDDGCASTMTCPDCEQGLTCVNNRCVCEDDAAEPNSRSSQPSDRGTFVDRENAPTDWRSYILKGADVDWFRLSIIDENDAKNPQVTVSLRSERSDLQVEVSITYACNPTATQHSCTNGTLSADRSTCEAILNGGKRSSLALKANCGRVFSETGEALIRVARVCSERPCPEECVSYDLGIQVTGHGWSLPQLPEVPSLPSLRNPFSRK